MSLKIFPHIYTSTQIELTMLYSPTILFLRNKRTLHCCERHHLYTLKPCAISYLDLDKVSSLGRTEDKKA